MKRAGETSVSWTEPRTRSQAIVATGVLVLGAYLYQAFRHEDEAEDLGSLRNDVAQHLSPFPVGVQGAKGDDQPMPVSTRTGVRECPRRNSSSLDGSFPLGCLLSAEPFSVKILGHHDGDENSGPIGDRVAEERAHVGRRVGEDVQQDQKEYDAQC